MAKEAGDALKINVVPVLGHLFACIKLIWLYKKKESKSKFTYSLINI